MATKTTTHKATQEAAILRAVLKNDFPAIKFRVLPKTPTNAAHQIYVTWTDGPSEDGMNDWFKKNNKFSLTVWTYFHRQYSVGLLQSIADDVCSQFAQPNIQVVETTRGAWPQDNGIIINLATSYGSTESYRLYSLIMEAARGKDGMADKTSVKVGE